MKQYAEEKFSATSLSATNIRNENAKSKANREYKSLYSHTPIRFGEMECNSFDHIGSEKIVEVLLIHSVSPHARQLVEEFSTGNPYLSDIKLDDDSSNRSAEIVQTYLKAIGLMLEFKKVKKKKVNPFGINPFEFDQFSTRHPFEYIPQDNLSQKQLNKYLKDRNKYLKESEERWEKGELEDPFIFFDSPN